MVINGPVIHATDQRAPVPTHARPPGAPPGRRRASRRPARPTPGQPAPHPADAGPGPAA